MVFSALPFSLFTLPCACVCARVFVLVLVVLAFLFHSFLLFPLFCVTKCSCGTCSTSIFQQQHHHHYLLRACVRVCVCVCFVFLLIYAHLCAFLCCLGIWSIFTRHLDFRSQCAHARASIRRIKVLFSTDLLLFDSVFFLSNTLQGRWCGA